MFAIVETLLPYLAVLCLLVSEAFAGWCLWQSIQCDLGRSFTGPNSQAEFRRNVQGQSETRQRSEERARALSA